MLILFLYLTHFLIISLFPWDEKKGLVRRRCTFIPPCYLWLVLKKKVFAVLLRTKLAYFGLCLYLLFFSSALPSLCLFFPSSESYVDITWCEAWSLKRLGHGVQVHGDFCLITPQTVRLQCFLHLRHNIFRHQFAKQVGLEYPACPWFVRAGVPLSLPLTLGLNSHFCHTNK